MPLPNELLVALGLKPADEGFTVGAPVNPGMGDYWASMGMSHLKAMRPAANFPPVAAKTVGSGDDVDDWRPPPPGESAVPSWQESLFNLAKEYGGDLTGSLFGRGRESSGGDTTIGPPSYSTLPQSPALLPSVDFSGYRLPEGASDYFGNPALYGIDQSGTGPAQSADMTNRLAVDLDQFNRPGTSSDQTGRLAVDDLSNIFRLSGSYGGQPFGPGATMPGAGRAFDPQAGMGRAFDPVRIPTREEIIANDPRLADPRNSAVVDRIIREAEMKRQLEQEPGGNAIITLDQSGRPGTSVDQTNRLAGSDYFRPSPYTQGPPRPPIGVEAKIPPDTRLLNMPGTGQPFDPQAGMGQPFDPQAGTGRAFDPQAGSGRAFDPVAGTGRAFDPVAGTGQPFDPVAGMGQPFNPQAGTGQPFNPVAGTGQAFDPVAGTGQAFDPVAGTGRAFDPIAGTGRAFNPVAGTGQPFNPQAGMGQPFNPQAGTGQAFNPQAGTGQAFDPVAGTQGASTSPGIGSYPQTPFAGKGLVSPDAVFDQSGRRDQGGGGPGAFQQILSILGGLGGGPEHGTLQGQSNILGGQRQGFNATGSLLQALGANQNTNLSSILGAIGGIPSVDLSGITGTLGDIGGRIGGLFGGQEGMAGTLGSILSGMNQGFGATGGLLQALGGNQGNILSEILRNRSMNTAGQGDLMGGQGQLAQLMQLLGSGQRTGRSDILDAITGIPQTDLSGIEGGQGRLAQMMQLLGTGQQTGRSDILDAITGIPQTNLTGLESGQGRLAQLMQLLGTGQQTGRRDILGGQTANQQALMEAISGIAPANLAGLEGGLQGLGGEMSGVQGLMSALGFGQQGLRTDLAGQQGDIASILEGIQGLPGAFGDQIGALLEGLQDAGGGEVLEDAPVGEVPDWMQTGAVLPTMGPVAGKIAGTDQAFGEEGADQFLDYIAPVTGLEKIPGMQADLKKLLSGETSVPWLEDIIAGQEQEQMFAADKLLGSQAARGIAGSTPGDMERERLKTMQKAGLATSRLQALMGVAPLQQNLMNSMFGQGMGVENTAFDQFMRLNQGQNIYDQQAEAVDQQALAQLLSALGMGGVTPQMPGFASTPGQPGLMENIGSMVMNDPSGAWNTVKGAAGAAGDLWGWLRKDRSNNTNSGQGQGTWGTDWI